MHEQPTLPAVPYGCCHCGCGCKTRVPKHSNVSKGWIAGVPLKYCVGHWCRKPWTFTVEDRGHPTPCWVWGLSIRPDGYGQYRVAGRPQLAHRLSYERHLGPIPDGLQLDHLCRVRACINPAHLEPVTNTENMRRGVGVMLTPSIVRELRRRSAAGETQIALAREFGYGRSTVGHVVTRRSWKDIE